MCQVVRVDRADLYRVCSGFPLPVRSPRRSCSGERETEKCWPSRGPIWELGALRVGKGRALVLETV